MSKSHNSNKKYGTREESVIQLCITKKGPWLMGGKHKIISNFLQTGGCFIKTVLKSALMAT